jgi:hypothetical protein
MKKQITILAMACAAILLPAVSGVTTTSAQETQKAAKHNVDEFQISHISSTEEASKFSVRFSDAELKKPNLRIYNESDEEIYNERIAEGTLVFKVVTEEASGELTFALYDGSKRVATSKWQISTVNEVKVLAIEN